MGPQSSFEGSAIVEVLDRVLNKGIVIDAFVRVRSVGLDLVRDDMRVVIASVATYLPYVDAMPATLPAARGSLPTHKIVS